MKGESLNGCSRHYQHHMNTSGACSDWNSVENLQRDPGLNPFLAFKGGVSDNNCQGRSPRQRHCCLGFLARPCPSMFAVSQRLERHKVDRTDTKCKTAELLPPGSLALTSKDRAGRRYLTEQQKRTKLRFGTGKNVTRHACKLPSSWASPAGVDENHLPLAVCISRLLPPRDSTNNRWKIFTHMEMSPLNSHFLFLSLFLSNSE